MIVIIRDLRLFYASWKVWFHYVAWFNSLYDTEKNRQTYRQLFNYA